MNIASTGKITVISKIATPSKDGTKKYHKLGILTGSEAGMLSCSEEIHNVVEVGRTYEVEYVFNDQYNSFRINRMLSVAKQ